MCDTLTKVKVWTSIRILEHSFQFLFHKNNEYVILNTKVFVIIGMKLGCLSVVHVNEPVINNLSVDVYYLHKK